MSKVSDHSSELRAALSHANGRVSAHAFHPSLHLTALLQVPRPYAHETRGGPNHEFDS
jgi:hypothetical protein